MDVIHDSDAIQILYDIGMSKEDIIKILGNKRSKRSTRWKGGVKWMLGYCYLKKVNDYNNYKKRADIVLERKLGRPLLPNELAHHINKNRGDDRPENLEVRTTDSHRAEHNRENGLRKDNKYDCPGISQTSTGVFVTRIGIGNGERLVIGYFKNLKEAIEARKQAEKKYWGS